MVKDKKNAFTKLEKIFMDYMKQFVYAKVL